MAPPTATRPKVLDMKVSADFKTEAKFLRLFMSLDGEVRTNSSHVFSPTTLLGETVRGMVVTCSYRGGDCLNET